MENQNTEQSNSNVENGQSDIMQGLNRATNKIVGAVKETFGPNQSDQQKNNQ